MSSTCRLVTYSGALLTMELGADRVYLSIPAAGQENTAAARRNLMDLHVSYFHDNVPHRIGTARDEQALAYVDLLSVERNIAESVLFPLLGNLMEGMRPGIH